MNEEEHLMLLGVILSASFATVVTLLQLLVLPRFRLSASKKQSISLEPRILAEPETETSADSSEMGGMGEAA